MKKVTYEDVLFADTKSQDFCVSIYASNMLELQRLMDEAKIVARQDLNAQQYSCLFDSVETEMNVIDTFPVAVFLSAHQRMFVPLLRCLEELFVVSTTFHIKPLIKMHQRNKNLALLSFSAKEVKLFQVGIKGLILLDIFNAPLSHQDYLNIDQYVSSLLEGKKPLLVYAGSKQHIEKFHKISTYGNIYPEPIEIKKNFKGRDFLKYIYTHIEPYFTKIESKVLRLYETAQQQGRVITEPNEIFKQALCGSIKALYIAEDKKIWGYLDTYRNKVAMHLKQVDSYDDDVLDDLSEIVLKFKGVVVALPQSEMPEKAVMFAILRDNYQRTILHKKMLKIAK